MRLRDMLANAYHRARFGIGLRKRIGEVQTASRTFRAGTGYGGCVGSLEGMGPGSIVYSVGTGEDLSFDLDIIERFGCAVHGFDPTPKAVARVAKQSLPPQFRFHALGMGSHDGSADFFLPANPEHASGSVVQRSGGGLERVSVQLRTLASVMRELGHRRVDILKLDIEGAEYDVIDEICATHASGDGVPVSQILVEFHHRFFADGPQRTRRAIDRLNERGFSVFDISANDVQSAFIKR